MAAGTPSPGGGSSAFNNSYGNGGGSGLCGASTPGGLHLPNSGAAEAGLRAAAADKAKAQQALARSCITYWIKDSLYVAVTNRCNVRVCVCVFWGLEGREGTVDSSSFLSPRTK